MVQDSENLKLISKKTIEGFFIITLYNQNLIEVYWDENLKEVDIEHLIALNDINKELGKGKSMLLLFSNPKMLSITNNAKKFAANPTGGAFTKANAVVVNRLSSKIIFNFIMKVSKPKEPTQAFSTREEAIDWLLQFNV